MSERNENKFTRFLNGKGFYAVLALCIAGAGAAAYLAMDSAANRVAQKPSPSAASSVTIDENVKFPRLEEAAGKQDGVKVESSRPFSSSSSAQSSPSQRQEASGGSKQSDVQASSAKLSLEMPLNGEVFTPYSNGELVKSETLGDWRTHNGIDIAAAEGTAVKAAAKGKVTKIKNDSLWGYMVEITHSGKVVSRYCGLSKQLSVKEGDDVKLGEIIGLIGYIPAESVMPTHLHFECKRDGKYIDPRTLIS